MKESELMGAIKILRRLVLDEYPSYSLAHIAETWVTKITPEEIAVLAALDLLFKESDGPS